jgi:RecB family exonuclease
MDRLVDELEGLGAGHVLVVCRTAAQVASLRLRMAQRGGAAGVLVTTLEGLAEQAAPPVRPVPTEPPTSPLLERIGRRPGLLRLARSHAVAFALDAHPQVGSESPSADRAREMAGWQETPWVATEASNVGRLLHGLAARAAEARPGPNVILAFDAVRSVGFEFDRLDEAAFLARWAPETAGEERPLDPVAPWQRRALTLLRAGSEDSPEARHSGPVPALAVSDPSAEARLATWLLRRSDGKNALVLVPDATTAARLVAAGHRNGVAVAELESAPLSSHALAGTLRVAVRWFEGGAADPLVRGTDLDAVLTHPLVGASFPKGLHSALVRELEALGAGGASGELGDSPTRLSRREVRRGLREARIVEAPLSRWIERLVELEGTEGVELDQVAGVRRRARLLRGRLERLRDCVGGVRWGFEEPADDEEFVGEADLDGGTEERRFVLPTPGTLGAARRFLLDCTLRIHRDPIGQGLMAALRDSGPEAADAAGIAAVLEGKAKSGRLASGVEVLRYDDYDGRTTDRLLLLGVHSKGMGKASAPDPLLDDASLAAVGVLAGARVRLFRLLQARRAAARSARPFVIKALRDSTGRAVTPPLELELDLNAGADLLVAEGLDPAQLDRGEGLARLRGSYGLDLPLPEAASRDALQLRDAEDDGPPEVGPLSALSDQATIEWCRSGRGPGQRGPDPAGPTLEDLLTALGPLGPERLGPYLGEAGEPPESGLGWLPADGQWSVTGQFTSLTNCLYRFFAERVLRIREDEAISDELDAAEVGTTVHAALEEANPIGGGGIRWRVPADELVQAREDAVAQLRTLTAAQFATSLAELGHQDEAQLAAGEGLRARWSAHWPTYAETRVRAVEELRASAETHLTAAIMGCDAFDPALDALKARAVADSSVGQKLAEWQEKTANRNKPGKWLAWAAVQTLRGNVPAALDKKALCSGLIQDFEATLRDTLLSASFLALVEDAEGTFDDLTALIPVLWKPASAIDSELPFGRNAADATDRAGHARLLAATLRLADRDVPVSGAIDRVLLVVGPAGGVVELLDYKTGGAVDRSILRKKVASLEMPQLPVYGLVLDGLLAKDAPLGALPAGTRMAAWGYDYVRKGTKKGLVDRNLLAGEEKEAARAALSGLTRRTLEGSFPPVPLEDLGPGSRGSSWGWPKGAVSLRDASRFEALPAQDRWTDEPDAGEEGDEG